MYPSSRIILGCGLALKAALTTCGDHKQRNSNLSENTKGLLPPVEFVTYRASVLPNTTDQTRKMKISAYTQDASFIREYHCRCSDDQALLTEYKNRKKKSPSHYIMKEKLTPVILPEEIRIIKEEICQQPPNKDTLVFQGPIPKTN